MDSKSTNLACTFETMKRIPTTAIGELLEVVRGVVVDDDKMTAGTIRRKFDVILSLNFRADVRTRKNNRVISLLLHASLNRVVSPRERNSPFVL